MISGIIQLYIIRKIWNPFWIKSGKQDTIHIESTMVLSERKHGSNYFYLTTWHKQICFRWFSYHQIFLIFYQMEQAFCKQNQYVFHGAHIKFYWQQERYLHKNRNTIPLHYSFDKTWEVCTFKSIDLHIFKMLLK